jgi:hypothetical protein
MNKTNGKEKKSGRYPWGIPTEVPKPSELPVEFDEVQQRKIDTVVKIMSKIQTLHAQNLSAAEISKQVNISEFTISVAIKELSVINSIIVNIGTRIGGELDDEGT